MFSRLLALDAVRLGRLVLNVDSPEQDFHDSPALRLEPSDASVKRQASLVDIRSGSGGAELNATLAYLLHAHTKVDVSGEEQLKASTTITHQLKNSMDVFSTICADIGTRKWFEKILGKGRKIYMIVGYQTISHGVLSYTKSIGASAGMSVDVPVTGTPLDPSVGGGISGNTRREVHVQALDEQVYAVQYRKVEFEWLRSRDLDKASLEKGTRWKVYWGTRDEDLSDEEGDDASDVLESHLTDFVADKDLYNHKANPRREVIVGEETIFVPTTVT
jgi:hypothetical protein